MTQPWGSKEGIMTQAARPADQMQFAHSNAKSASPWKRIFRIIRWSSYTFALVVLVLLLHKAPPPLVETSPQAAARAEEKFEQVEKAVASGQHATLRMDEAELNTLHASHLALAVNSATKAPTTGGAQIASSTHDTSTR